MHPFYTLKHWPGAEQSDGPTDPQALPGLGKFPCCGTQEDLILRDETGDGLHGKWESLDTFLGKRLESQTFNKPDKDLATAFTMRQEHTHIVIVPVWKEKVEYEVSQAANRSVLYLPLPFSQERTSLLWITETLYITKRNVSSCAVEDKQNFTAWLLSDGLCKTQACAWSWTFMYSSEDESGIWL